MTGRPTKSATYLEYVPLAVTRPIGLCSGMSYESPQPEVKITEAMLAAGSRVFLCEISELDHRTAVRDIYRAMEMARRQAATTSPIP
jgi:hypothetical protein